MTVWRSVRRPKEEEQIFNFPPKATIQAICLRIQIDQPSQIHINKTNSNSKLLPITRCRSNKMAMAVNFPQHRWISSIILSLNLWITKEGPVCAKLSHKIEMGVHLLFKTSSTLVWVLVERLVSLDLVMDKISNSFGRASYHRTYSAIKVLFQLR